MIEINLMPDVKQELLRAQRQRTTVITFAILIGIISIGVVTILAVYTFGFQALRSVYADNQIKEKNTTLQQEEDLPKLLTIQNQLTKITDLNGKKQIDSRIFDMLRATLPSGDSAVTVSQLSLISEDGINSIQIDAQAPGSYSSAELFKKTLESAVVQYVDSEGASQEVKLASNVALSQTSYGEDQNGNRTLRFTVTFDAAPELFDSKTDNVNIVISRRGNVTDSYLGVPQLFEDRAADVVEENN